MIIIIIIIIFRGHETRKDIPSCVAGPVSFMSKGGDAN